MPRISFFNGIAVYLYYEDHDPPHVHARYGSSQAKVAIGSGAIIEGSLPPRAARLVREWAERRAGELAECWERARRGEPPGTVAPLT